jgi:hypothetical protein
MQETKPILPHGIRNSVQELRAKKLVDNSNVSRYTSGIGFEKEAIE